MIQSQYSPDIYDGDGSQDTFAFAFRILAKTDLLVKTVDADGNVETLDLNSDYTIDDSDVDTAGGGEVVLDDPLPTGTKIFLIRNTARTQLINIEEFGAFPAATVIKEFDRLTMMIQEVWYKTRKALKFADTSVLVDVDLPTPEAGALLQWNSDEDGLQNTLASALGLTHVIIDVDVAAGESQATVTHGLGSSAVRIVGFTPNWGTGFSFNSQTDDAIIVDLTVEAPPVTGGMITFELAFS